MKIFEMGSIFQVWYRPRFSKRPLPYREKHCSNGSKCTYSWSLFVCWRIVGLLYGVQVQSHTQLSATTTFMTFAVIRACIACRVWEIVLFDLMPSGEVKMLIALIVNRIVAGISHQKIHGLHLFWYFKPIISPTEWECLGKAPFFINPWFS